MTTMTMTAAVATKPSPPDPVRDAFQGWFRINSGAESRAARTGDGFQQLTWRFYLLVSPVALNRRSLVSTPFATALYPLATLWTETTPSARKTHYAYPGSRWMVVFTALGTTEENEDVGWDAAAAADAAIEISDDDHGDPHGRFTDELFRQLATLQQHQHQQ